MENILLLVATFVRVFLVPVLRPLTGFFHDMQDKTRSLGSADWHKVNGRIESVNIATFRPADWIVTLLYSYSAGGEYWSGETSRRFFTEPDADEYGRQHPSGSIVVVRYRPDKVARSVVLKQDQIAVSAAGSI